MRDRWRSLFFVLLASIVLLGLSRIYSSLKVTGAFNPPNGATLPGTCAVGDEFTRTTDGTKHRCGPLANQWEQIGGIRTVDHLYPGTFKIADPVTGRTYGAPAWVDVPVKSDRIVMRRIRVFTDNQSWTAVFCQSKFGIVSSSDCVYSIGKGTVAGGGVGWKGDYADYEADRSYTDLDGTRSIHVRVNPVGGDWMWVRFLIDYEVL